MDLSLEEIEREIKDATRQRSELLKYIDSLYLLKNIKNGNLSSIINNDVIATREITTITEQNAKE